MERVRFTAPPVTLVHIIPMHEEPGYEDAKDGSEDDFNGQQKKKNAYWRQRLEEEVFKEKQGRKQGSERVSEVKFGPLFVFVCSPAGRPMRACVSQVATGPARSPRVCSR